MTGSHTTRFTAWHGAVALAAIVVVGLVLRMVPVWLGPAGAFTGDAAYHARLAVAVAETGALPAVDGQSDAPDGRHTAHLLPTGMYLLAGWLIRTTGADASLALQLMIALAGALIGPVVFLLARSLGIRPGYALVAAVAATLMPAHLHRTFGWWLRYDAIGTLFAAVHLAAFLYALRAESVRAGRWWSVIAAVALVLGAAFWRVALILPPIEAVVLCAVWVIRGRDARVRDALTVVVVTGSLGMLAIAYLREQQYLLSRAWLLVVLATVLHWFPSRPGRIARGAIAVGGLAGVWIAGALRPGGYDALAEIVQARFHSMLGSSPGDPLLRLMLSVEELTGVGVLEWPGPAYLSGMALLVVAAVVMLIRDRRGKRRAPLGTGTIVFVGVSIALLTLTALFARSKILLAPLLAAAIGWLAQRWLDPEAPGRGGARHAATRTLAVIALVAAFGWTAWDAWRLMRSRTAVMPADKVAVIESVARLTPPGAVIVAPWELGYEVQRYADRPTVMDGLLESAPNRRQIVAFAQAALAQPPDSLERYCESVGAEWLVVPPSTQLYGVAVVADVPFVEKLIPGIPLTPAEGDRTLIRMMLQGGHQGAFVEQVRHGQWRLMRLER